MPNSFGTSGINFNAISWKNMLLRNALHVLYETKNKRVIELKSGCHMNSEIIGSSNLL